MAKKNKDILERLVPILLVLTIALAGAVGYLFSEMNKLKSRSTNVANKQAGNQPVQPTNGKLSEEQAENVPGLKEDDHVRGSRDAKVFIVEYSDFQCPYCASFHPTAQQALDEYEGDVAWIYRHFPLDTLHPRARAAAEASECVADLGGSDAFWNFADDLFENQDTALTESGLVNAAASAGVGTAVFNTCVESGNFEQLVEDEYQEGIDAGVTGTPGNFVVTSDGQVWSLPGAVPFSSLQETIDEALAS